MVKEFNQRLDRIQTLLEFFTVLVLLLGDVCSVLVLLLGDIGGFSGILFQRNRPDYL